MVVEYKRPRHCEGIVESLYLYKQHGLFCDATLVVDDDQVSHKVPLFRVPLFKVLLFKVPLSGVPLFEVPLFRVLLFKVPLFRVPLFKVPLFKVPLHVF